MGDHRSFAQPSLLSAGEADVRQRTGRFLCCPVDKHHFVDRNGGDHCHSGRAAGLILGPDDILCLPGYFRGRESLVVLDGNIPGIRAPQQIHHDPDRSVYFFLLLSSPEGRKWLTRKEPYLSFLLGLAIFSPVILWNAQNDWMSFRFQLSHGLAVKKEVGLKYFGEYWGAQAGLVSPLMFLALLWAMAKSGLVGFRLKKEHMLLLFWTSAPVLLFFAFTSLRSKVEANWPALAYFSAVIALAGISTEEWSGWNKGKRGFAWAAGLTAFLFTFLAHLQPIHAVVPIAAGNDPTSQLHGWRALGERIKEVSKSMDPDREIFLLTPRHQLVGEGMFYTQGKIPVYQWDAPYRINHLSAIHAPPVGSQAIFFTEGGKELSKGVEDLFASCEELDPLVVSRNSSIVRTHPIWRCKGFKGLQCNSP